MKLFLIDAYALIYRSYYAFIKNPRINSKGMNTSAVFGFVNTLEELLKKENPSHLGVAFDPAGPTFRHEIYKEYKAQREETPEDIKKSVPLIKKIIEAYNIPILEVPGFEADDVIGTLAKKAAKDKFDVYMMTPDKDYCQLVDDNIFVYKPRFGNSGFDVLDKENVLEKYALKNTGQVVDLLGLMGDKADNIPGCPGVGEVTAKKLIAAFGTVENLLVEVDSLKGSLKDKIESNRDQIKFSKFLATIRTDVPIEFEAENFKRKNLDETKIKNIFDDLEFRNLSDRVLGKKDKPGVKISYSQPLLFAEFADEGAEENKFSNLSDINTVPHTYYILDNEEKTASLIDKIKLVKFMSFDTETTGIDAFASDLVGMSFSIKENEAYYLPFPKIFEEAKKIVEKFKIILEDEEILKIGQNIKYDIVVLKKYQITVRGNIFDTMIAHYLLNPELRHNMDYLAETYLHYKTVHIEELIGPKGKNQLNMRDVEIPVIAEYAAEDADVTLKLRNVFEPMVKKESFDYLLYRIEFPLVYVLADMEASGVRLDTSALKASSLELKKDLEKIEKEIYRMAGTEFNINSARQVGEILFDKLKIVDKAKKTKTGQYVTSEEVLESMRSKHPVVSEILAYRGVKKLLSTYVDALPSLINRRTGKVHTSFNQAVTSTGRLSSTNPNLQNIPIRDEEGREIRKAFIADEGFTFFSADYSQIELRIMAHLSEDKNMIEAFEKGYDIHAATASKIYKVPLSEVSREMRTKAKTANFGIIYGISVFGLSERLSISRSEAKDLIDGYFETYPDVKNYMNKSIEIARKKGFVETIFHRKRFLPDINSHNSVVRGYAERNAINAPIQGSAADIIKLAMVKIHQRFLQAKLKSQMILQVHDELNFNVINAEKELVKNIVIDEMQTAVKLRVPLVADYGFGNNWLEAH